MARELVVWRFVDKGTGIEQYILTEPQGDHVESSVPLYTEGSYPDQPPYAYRHDVAEPEDIKMTMYSVSSQNPWEGNGETTSVPLYT